MGLRRMLAVWAAKITEKISVHIFHRQGVTWAGKIALRICPSVLKELSGQVRKGIFIVCGTNGKTTTNNMLCAALQAEGNKVICNHTGSNMLNGVVAAFVLGAGNSGRLDADYACIEVDEASTRKVFPHFKPDYMVLTNLFRDQLDRYGEIDITMNILKEVMRTAPEMKVIVNGDDALSAYLAMESGCRYVTYGISEQVVTDNNLNEIREGRFCKRCGAPLSYKFYHYSQLGDYACTECDFRRPDIQFDASEVEVGGRLAFTVEGRRISADYKGFYNVYNILAAYAAGRTAGLKLEQFNRMLETFNPENGRMERFTIGETKILLNLAKNPAGFNQNISAVMQDASRKDIIIVINDNAQDGTDVSWLWDVDFDRFKEDDVNSVTVSGIRCHDMGLRLKYTDILNAIQPDVEKAICERVENGCGNLYVLVNYTALFSTRNVLKRLEGER
ncbi:MurT ligase domain-containing protein [[Clostridium] hylemonae]|uniref:MurT ligase domain-containing protein n=1 Tax=[Clostridium] hylemonae TaxID=89153 RepID=UPI001FCAA56A|nr:MurT ligase domain-containing protein [[Clostridium] hylemonae]BDF04008.1 UDP-N-acetylmuramyl peptide synthase [[Clostridium] hylemonae]